MAQKLGYFEEAGLDVAIQTPSDPAAPIKQVAAGQHRPGDLLRARGGAGPRTGPRRGRRRRPRQPAADLDDLAEEVGDQGRRRPARQDDRHRRHPLPGRLPEDDPRPRQAHARRRQGGQRRLRPAAGAASAAAPRRCSAASATSRASTCAQRGKDPVVTPVDQLGVPTYDELVLVAQPQAASKKTRRRSASSSPRSRAAPRPRSKSPEAATKALLEANPDLDPKLTRAEVEGDAAAARRAAQGQPYGYMDPAAVERRSSAGCATTA